jgi:hypothetical protein
VVFYRQGHVYLMRQMPGERGDVKLVDSLKYLPK